jgi:alkylation response protein AidB-like acyl-CoA dehydrogenase
MSLVLSEDQELIGKTAADFVAQRSPVARFRALRDAKDGKGYTPPLWKEMADLGWLGIPFPESVGGAGLGLADLAVVLEALGRTLAPEPFVATLLLAGRAIAQAGSEAQQQQWLPGVVAGERVLAFAYQEAKGRFDLHRVETKAEKAGAGYRITGEKVAVLDAGNAEAFVVAARTSGGAGDAEGITLFLVPKGASGLEIVPQVRIDHRNAGIVKLAGVEVSPADVLGKVGGGGAILEATVDYATAGLCAEMLGAMAHAFAITVEHLKTREQFGVPIGSFQALKHRAANCFIEIELARSCVLAAVRAVDTGDAEAPRLVSLAKARCSDAFVLVANEGVQMFGGVGMTDEYDIGLYMKRARVAELTFGDAAYHRDRWAKLGKY